MNQNDQPLLPRWLSVAIYVTVAVILVLLLAVHVTGVWKWHVDSVTFLLLVVLLVIPVAERLRRIKVGKYLEADFDALRARVESVGRDVSNLRDITLSPEERSGTATETEGVAAANNGGDAVAISRTIDRIVWVDDQPANNRVEMAELQRRFEVIPATSTAEGLGSIVDPETTLVITDAVRVEGGKTNVEAGVELLEALHQKHPAIPAYVYCGQKTVEEHAAPLEAAGARLVTSSFTELARRVRADARSSFEAEVAAELRRRGTLSAQNAGLDFVLETGGKLIGVEAKDYRRTPKAEAFDRAVGLLDDAVKTGRVGQGLLVTPRDVFAPKQRQRTPDSVRLLPVTALAQALTQEEMPARS